MIGKEVDVLSILQTMFAWLRRSRMFIASSVICLLALQERDKKRFAPTERGYKARAWAINISPL